MLDKP